MSEFIGAIKDQIMGKFVEIFQGDTHRTLTGYADFNHEDKSVLYGKVIAADGECITLEVIRGNKIGNVFVNTWSISTITIPESGISMKDAYWASPAVTHERVK